MKSKSIALSDAKIGVIGFGNLAGALISGALKKRVLRPTQILAVKHRPEKDRDLKKKYRMLFVDDIADVCRLADVILLAVKPQQMKDVLVLLRPYYRGQLVITVAAGLKTRFYQRYLGKTARVIRVMPNTAAAIGLGASAFFASESVTKADKTLCRDFFGATGFIEEVLNEKLIDAVIAVSGSGIAFVYKYALSVIEGGTKMGLKTRTARDLALKTLVGAAEMLRLTGSEPEELISQVTSKKGTTLAGLAVLEKKGFTRLIQAAMSKAARRAKEISEELENNSCRF